MLGLGLGLAVRRLRVALLRLVLLRRSIESFSLFHFSHSPSVNAPYPANQQAAVENEVQEKCLPEVDYAKRALQKKEEEVLKLHLENRTLQTQVNVLQEELGSYTFVSM